MCIRNSGFLHIFQPIIAQHRWWFWSEYVIGWSSNSLSSTKTSLIQLIHDEKLCHLFIHFISTHFKNLWIHFPAHFSTNHSTALQYWRCFSFWSEKSRWSQNSSRVPRISSIVKKLIKAKESLIHDANYLYYLFQFLINLKSLHTFFCKSLTMQVWEFCTCSWNSLGLLNSFIQILQQTGSISSKIPPKMSKLSSSKWSVFKWFSKSGGVKKNLRHSLHDNGWTLISILFSIIVLSWFETRPGLEFSFVWTRACRFNL